MIGDPGQRKGSASSRHLAKLYNLLAKDILLMTSTKTVLKEDGINSGVIQLSIAQRYDANMWPALSETLGFG